jgi:DNA-binding transcriptional regulator GbsR (MarR family)
MSEVVMPGVLDALSKIGGQWELGESVWRVWGCILLHTCPVSQKEIGASTGYSSGLVSINVQKLKRANMINETSMGGDKRYFVNTSLSDAFGTFSKQFFEDNIKPVIALLSENVDKIENAKVKNTCCELINDYEKLNPMVLVFSKIIEDINTRAITGEKMEERNMIIDFTGAFRNSIADLNYGSKVVFTGSVAVCTPFIELLAYAVRDQGFKMVYVPKANANEARRIKEVEHIGYSVVDEKADPKNPDAIVVLGGLVMPKFGCEPEEVTRLIEELSREKKPKVIGVGFMNIFERSGWDKKLKFDTLIDAAVVN